VKHIRTAAVLGAGTMGAQIGSLIAIHGYPVAITDAIPDALGRAQQRIDEQVLPELQQSGTGTLDPAGARANVAFEPDLERAIDGVDLVIDGSDSIDARYAANDAAAALGVPLGTLWRRVFHARKALREALGGDA